MIRHRYHELFGKALQDYNSKQNRPDRRIDDYYKKIVSGKQEKPFHEVILQIGNKDDMNAETDEGRLAEKILTEYIKTFQERNPNISVFSAHLHMDEATPHLHIDFVPFTTGSKRGLETRVSLKQALAKQGFKGGTRGDTEWNQWVLSEKEELSKIMRDLSYWSSKMEEWLARMRRGKKKTGSGDLLIEEIPATLARMDGKISSLMVLSPDNKAIEIYQKKLDKWQAEFEELKNKPSILSGIFKKAKEDIEKTLKKLDN